MPFLLGSSEGLTRGFVRTLSRIRFHRITIAQRTTLSNQLRLCRIPKYPRCRRRLQRHVTTTSFGTSALEIVLYSVQCNGMGHGMNGEVGRAWFVSELIAARDEPPLPSRMTQTIDPRKLLRAPQVDSYLAGQGRNGRHQSE